MNASGLLITPNHDKCYSRRRIAPRVAASGFNQEGSDGDRAIPWIHEGNRKNDRPHGLARANPTITVSFIPMTLLKCLECVREIHRLGVILNRS